MELGAIILSGGKSSRFGMDKGLFVFRDQALIEYAINTCKQFTNNIIIISNSKEYEAFRHKVVPDIYPNSGPMGGIHTGLTNCVTDLNLVISCDTPFIQKDLIQMMLDKYSNEDVLISGTSDGRYQTLIGLYHKKIKDQMELALELNHFKMIKFIQQMNHHIIPIPKDHRFNKSFINFNYQSEAKQYER